MNNPSLYIREVLRRRSISAETLAGMDSHNLKVLSGTIEATAKKAGVSLFGTTFEWLQQEQFFAQDHLKYEACARELHALGFEPLDVRRPFYYRPGRPGEIRTVCDVAVRDPWPGGFDWWEKRGVCIPPKYIVYSCTICRYLEGGWKDKPIYSQGT